MEPANKKLKLSDEQRQRENEIADIVARGASNSVEEVETHQKAEKLVISLEKKINENIRQRAKYAGKPASFMGSEVDLDEQIKKLHGGYSTSSLSFFIARHNNHAF